MAEDDASSVFIGGFERFTAADLQLYTTMNFMLKPRYFLSGLISFFRKGEGGRDEPSTARFYLDFFNVLCPCVFEQCQQGQSDREVFSR